MATSQYSSFRLAHNSRGTHRAGCHLHSRPGVKVDHDSQQHHAPPHSLALPWAPCGSCARRSAFHHQKHPQMNLEFGGPWEMDSQGLSILTKSVYSAYSPPHQFSSSTIWLVEQRPSLHGMLYSQHASSFQSLQQV